MTARHVVAVDVDENDVLTVSLSKAPVAITGARRPQPLDCDPNAMPPWITPAAVRLHGTRLFDKLTAAHPAISQVLTTALQTPPGKNPAVYFHLLADDAERLCWESLYEQTSGFLTLQRQWAIARMADTGADIDRPPVAVFDAPLRVMALLSAHGVNAEPEWEKLKDAVAAGRALGLPIRLSLLIGEEELYDAITAEITDEALIDICVQPMPQRIDRLKSLVDREAPHIIHFFSHGSVGYGSAALQMAHFRDVGALNGSLTLPISELLGFEAMRSVWMVTLNCCDSGRAVPEMHSMAHRLVANGVPAALGMMEPISPDDAHELCGAFYESMFAYLRHQHSKIAAGGQIELEWSQLLHPARSALRDLHISQGLPESRREWTLPVLYVRPEPFYVSGGGAVVAGAPVAPHPPAGEVSLARVETVTGFLRSLPPDAPRDLRAQALSLLDNVAPHLRPDEFGIFRP